MKKVCITYKMRCGDEVAETCAVLPMTDARADNILTYGENSLFILPGWAVFRVLNDLALIQGYDYDGFCSAEKFSGSAAPLVTHSAGQDKSNQKSPRGMKEPRGKKG